MNDQIMKKRKETMKGMFYSNLNFHYQFLDVCNLSYFIRLVLVQGFQLDPSIMINRIRCVPNHLNYQMNQRLKYFFPDITYKRFLIVIFGLPKRLF